MKLMRVLAALLVVMLAVLALGPAPAVRAGSAQIHVFPPQARPFGHTYTEWEVRFWQWLMAIPKAENPVLDTSGAHCAEGQSGPVWYLLNDMGGSDVRTCTVPPGKALLIAPAIWECDTADGNGNSEAELRSCAKSNMDGVTRADVTVDGVQFANLLTRYRFETPLFTFHYPAGNVNDVPGSGTTKAVGDGIYVMLAPLAAGQHTIELGGKDPSQKWDGTVTYHLTIGR